MLHLLHTKMGKGYDKKTLSIKQIILILSILLVAKFSIDIAYQNGYIQPDKWKYLYLTSSMENINTIEFKQLLESKSDKINMIYIGRDNCPTCVSSIDKIKNIFNKQKENDSLVRVFYYNTKKNNDSSSRELRNNLHIDYIPAIIVIKNNEKFLFKSEDLILDDYLQVFNQNMDAAFA